MDWKKFAILIGSSLGIYSRQQNNNNNNKNKRESELEEKKRNLMRLEQVLSEMRAIK